MSYLKRLREFEHSKISRKYPILSLSLNCNWQSYWCAHCCLEDQGSSLSFAFALACMCARSTSLKPKQCGPSSYCYSMIEPFTCIIEHLMLLSVEIYSILYWYREHSVNGLCQRLCYISLLFLELLRDECEGFLCIFIIVLCNGWFLIGRLADTRFQKAADNQIYTDWEGLIRAMTSWLQESAIPSFSPLKLSRGIMW